MKSEQKQQTFTREEILTTLAGVYRAEQCKNAELARTAERAAQQGAAAEYVIADEAYQRQIDRMDSMLKMVTALGIGEQEFMTAVNIEE